MYHDILASVACGKEIDAIYLDLSKAFDRVSHYLLIAKLERYGICGPLLHWLRSYLSGRYQRVVLEGAYSDWLPVSSGVPQGSILGPLLFIVYANDLPDYAINGSTLALFADDSKLYRTMVSDLSLVILQHDLDSLFKWSMDWHMTFNVAKCKTLHFSKKKFPTDQSQYHLGGQPLERVSVIKDLGVSVSCDLKWGRHIAEIVSKSSKILGLS